MKDSFWHTKFFFRFQLFFVCEKVFFVCWKFIFVWQNNIAKVMIKKLSKNDHIQNSFFQEKVWFFDHNFDWKVSFRWKFTSTCRKRCEIIQTSNCTYWTIKNCKSFSRLFQVFNIIINIRVKLNKINPLTTICALFSLF